MLVPVACSGSHVGYGTVRLEPTWLQIGESAGYAAALAADRGLPPAELDVTTLQRTLAEAQSRLTFFSDSVPGDDEWSAAIQFCGTKGFFAGFNAQPDTWLDAKTARVWAETAASVLTGDIDGTAAARKLTDRGDDPVTARRFAELIARASDRSNVSVSGILDSVPAAPDTRITRRTACQIVYEFTGDQAER